MSEQNLLNQLGRDGFDARNDLPSAPDDQERLLRMVEENLRLSRSLAEDMKRVRRYLLWQRIMAVFWVILLVAPLILATIWLPSFISNTLGPYQDLLSGNKNALDLLDRLK